MEHLPPVGWADVATKTDLDVQSALLRTEIENSELRMRAGFSELRLEVVQLRVDMGEKFNRLLFQLLASMAGFVSLVLVLSRKG